MKTLLLTVILIGLVSALRAQDALPFLSEDQNLIGTWYEKAVVTNRNMTEKMFKMAFPVVVTALEEGKLDAKVTLMLKGECIQYHIEMQKTELPGKYTTFNGKVPVYIYELPLEDHYIFYSEDEFFGMKLYMGKLVGRNPEENLEALEELKKFTQHKGLPQENIFVPEQREKCVSEHGKATVQVCTCRRSSATKKNRISLYHSLPRTTLSPDPNSS